MNDSPLAKHFDLYLLLSALVTSFCFSYAFWLATFADVFDYIIAAGYTFVGCVNFSLGISDYVDEKIKLALRDRTHQQPTTEENNEQQ